MPVEDAFVDAYNLAGIQAIRRLGAADKDLAKVTFGLQCDGAAGYSGTMNPLVAAQATALNK